MTGPDYRNMEYSAAMAAFFGSGKNDKDLNTDGFVIGSFGGEDTSRAKARSAEAYRLVKASKCPTARSAGHLGPTAELAGIKYSPEELNRANRRRRAAATGNEREWLALAEIDHPGQSVGGLLFNLDARHGADDAVQPLPDFDPSRIGDDSEQTHHLDLTTGEITRTRRAVDCVGSRAVIERLDWADEYRIRTKTALAITALPPEQAGPRFTEMLSLEGARKISDSCRYVAKENGGFSTFFTLTMDDAARQRVADYEPDGPCTVVQFTKGGVVPVKSIFVGTRYVYSPGSGMDSRKLVRNPKGRGAELLLGKTIQSEVSRFFDAAQKIYQRGWTETFAGRECHGEEHEDKLRYVWVVENPKNEKGQDNPHVHVLMCWRVPYRDFRAWAQRLERLWGQGFATLEKIKEPEKAGAYIAKAAGYLTKGQDGGQGRVRGNRYGISQDARAPGWEIVGIYNNGLMGTLIRDVYDHFMFEHGSKMQRRNRLKEKLDETPKEEGAIRQKIGKALEEIRKELNDSEKIPLRPSKYQLVLTGVNAFRQFITWAKTGAECRGFGWLPPKEAGVDWNENRAPMGPYQAEYERRQNEKRRSIFRQKIDRIKGMCSEYWQAILAGTEPDELDESQLSETDFMLA